MKQCNGQLSRLMKKAVSSDNLARRAAINQRYAENNFDQWARGLVDKLAFSSVLDVCCGTGNQLALFAVMPQVSRIVGVDISKGSLDIARQRLLKMKVGKKIALKSAAMEEMFLEPDLKDFRFDLISCFFGLYYAKDVEKVISGMLDHFSGKGAVLIAGPYGANNRSLFLFLEKYFKLPDLVKKSATTFMEKEVFPVLARSCSVEPVYFKNIIHYPDADSLMDYWRSSTFYVPKKKEAVLKDLKKHFDANDDFIVEKHVVAYIARRNK